MTPQEREELKMEILGELAKSLSIEIDAYNEPYGGPMVKVEISLNGEVIAKSSSSVPEPRTYTGYD